MKQETRKNSVLVFGSFDALHPGHLMFLKQAALYGLVTISLTPDHLLHQYKGHRSRHVFAVRQRRLEAICYVKRIISSDPTPGSYSVLHHSRPDIVVLGYDQRSLLPALQAKLKTWTLPTRVVVARPYRPQIYHSRLLDPKGILVRRSS